MRLKLCARCSYGPRDLADHYDQEAALHLCATCNVEYNLRKTRRRRTCPSTTINTAGIAELHVAPYVTEISASFAIIAAAPPSVQGSASSVSRLAGTATAIGYGDFELPRTEAEVTQGYPGNRNFRTGS